MDIKNIAEKINDLSNQYKIGNLQNIRKQLRGLSKINFNSIFSPKTVFDNKDIYAFHYGGRSEIQFNIGWEMESRLFRYGLAFSLEKSQSLREPVNILGPKIQKFNEYIQAKPGKYSDFEMWDYRNGKRSNNSQAGLINRRLIKTGTFIFIGKYFNKQVEDINNADLHEILKTFDRLLKIYEYVEGNNVIEDKIARICWNNYGWRKPSGPEGKSKNKKAYEHTVGYGHEEWLLDTEKLVNGYHYGYLQPVGKAGKKYQNRSLNISLYSINYNTGERWWIGTIEHVYVISPDEVKKVYINYKEKGWLNEMIQQIKNVGGHEKEFLKNSPRYFANVKFKPASWHPLEPRQRFSNKNKVVPLARYILLNKHKEPDIELPFGDDPPFEGGYTARKKRGVMHHGPRTSINDDLHDRMQDNVYKQLIEIYGKDKVRMERPLNSIGVKVDLSIKDGDREIFFELKTSNSIRACIREALSQILEYSYYPDKDRAKKLIIVSQNPINKQAKDYLNKLRKQFNIPVYYKQYNIDKNCLDDAELK